MEKAFLNYDKSGTEYQQLIATITNKLNASRHSWEVDEELHTLWILGDYGDISAFLRYAAALLMEGKDWYNPDEARTVLEAIIEGTTEA